MTTEASASGYPQSRPTSRIHCEATYAKPREILDVHPDLDFSPSDRAATPFLHGKPRGGATSVGKKRDFQRVSVNPDAFWTDPTIYEIRQVLKEWRRSAVHHAPNKDLEIFVVDVVDPIIADNDVPETMKRRCGYELHQPWQLVQVIGHCLDDGSSVCLWIHGFSPYLLIECPKQLENNPAACDQLQKYLECHIGGGKDLRTKVVSVELVEGQSLMDYIPDRPQKFFKVRLSQQRLVASTRSLVESGIRILDTQLNSTPFEANVHFPLRWMIDNGIVGCGCLQVKVRDTLPVADSVRQTRCQRELHVFWEDIQAIPPVGKYASIPDKLRVLALDIECVNVSTTGGFPVPDNDPVIQISSMLTTPGIDHPMVQIIFTLDTCAPIPGAWVFSFADERAMLTMWREAVIWLDPDILTGYNFINFDLNYLILRSHTLGIPNFRNLGRVIHIETKIRDTTLSTRALGTHENKDINIEGRVQFDALELIRRDHKLKSYTLNAASSQFLKEQKEDVHYSQMGDLQRGGEETRRRIAVYCLKDSHLVIRLLNKLCLLVNYVEMARVTGVPLPLLLTRGQQIKVMSQLLRKCREVKHFMPSLRVQGGGDTGDVAYEGATVLEPLRDFYEQPIATLDFASLYPSIMIAHNLCYTTVVPSEAHLPALGLKETDVYRTPAGKTFVKQHVKTGILPTIVADLLAARKAVKKEMAQAKDPLYKMVLDGRQSALKVSANSVYGYTGAAATGQLPCLAISESITAYGRQMIDFTKTQVEERFRKANGYTYDATVIYGDTDSVMVKFGVDNVAEAMELGREAAQFVSGQFQKPIALEFEKVYFPYLLMAKKRYAGLMWTQSTKYHKIDCKGIETVRRDFCLLVQQMVDDALRALLIRRDVEGARRMTKQRIQDLLMNRIDMSYLVLSKSLGKEDYAAKLAHVELAKKLRKRDPATAPQIGDRVYYVIIAGAKGQAQYERAEDPLYALEHNIPIDVDFYLESIRKPIERIFEPIEKGNIASLFTGAHTLQKKVVTSTSGALFKFVTTGLRCMGCRGVIKEGAFCDHCRDAKATDVVLQKTKEFREKEAEFNGLWVQCQRCQGSLHEDVICTSRDCPIFYRRMKVKKEINELSSNVMARLDAEFQW